MSGRCYVQVGFIRHRLNTLQLRRGVARNGDEDMKKILMSALAVAALTLAIAPVANAEIGEKDAFPSPFATQDQQRRRYQDQEPRYTQPTRRYEQAPRYEYERAPVRDRGWGRGCNAVKGTFCWLPRAQPMGSNCNCPKGGGVREGYVDR
jgi:hypothetical protein